jgi:hypothetical protein
VRLIKDSTGTFIPSSLTMHKVTVKQCSIYDDFGYDIDDDNHDKGDLTTMS